jgi:hypothetical protein
MKIFVLATIGCAFWLALLSLAISRIAKFGVYERGFGYDYDLVPLLGIPVLLMIATVTLAVFAARAKFSTPVIVAASVASGLGLFIWIAIWGKSI